MNKILGILIFFLMIGGVFAATPEITQFVYNPSPAVPGSITTIFIQIENNESISQNNVIIELEDSYPFEVKEEKIKNLGTIVKYGKALAQFQIYVDPSAENMTYSIPITITSKEQPIGKTTNREIIISGKEPIVKVINISEIKLIPGQEQEIEFEVQNIGTSSAYDVTVELQEDRTVTASGLVIEREITPLGSAMAYIEKIEPKQKTSVKIKVSVNREAQLKNYTLPVEITYRNSSGVRTQEESFIGFKVSGTVNLDLALKEQVIFIAGQTTNVTFELFNKGFGKAEFTIVNIAADFGEVEKPKQFIGSLEPNDVDSFKTNILVDNILETQEMLLKATIDYQDTDAQMRSTVLEIPVTIYNANDGAIKQGINPFSGIINLIILAIIVFVGWKIYKKFQNKN